MGIDLRKKCITLSYYNGVMNICTALYHNEKSIARNLSTKSRNSFNLTLLLTLLSSGLLAIFFYLDEIYLSNEMCSSKSLQLMHPPI